MRAQGNGFGVTGWAIGVGTTTLANPSLFGKLANRAYFLFAGFNLIWILIVFLFYPETKDRSLESINLLFEPNSPFNSAAERSWKEHNGGDIIAGRERDVENRKKKIESNSNDIQVGVLKPEWTTNLSRLLTFDPSLQNRTRRDEDSSRDRVWEQIFQAVLVNFCVDQVPNNEMYGCI